MKKSLWQKYNDMKKLNSINENMSTDVLIIGAGITGVSVAYNLINHKENVILIDRNKCCDGVTSKSTGKLTYLQDLMYQKIVNTCGMNAAKLYFESQKEAIRIVKKNVKNENIDCDLKQSESIAFTKNLKELPKFEAERRILDELDVNYSNLHNKFLLNDVKDVIKVKNTYVFNPVKYVISLLKKVINSPNILVYENSIATKIKKENDFFIVMVNGFEIKTKKVVIACNYPFFTIPGLIPFKTYVEKSYICASKIGETQNLNAISSNYPCESFRYYYDGKDKYFIYLNNSSKICDKLNYEKNYKQCVKKIKEITNDSPIYRWENMDVLTNDNLPLIGRISLYEKNVFIATGYNTWGMTNGVIAGKVISDLILNKKNKYVELFNPSRSINFSKFKNFIINTMISNVKAYTFNLIKKNPSWYKNKAIVTKINGKRVGVYFDSKGEKHVVSNICPHLKCFLTFNEVDKTWDCPCHGSRFDVDGNCVKGPSVYDIKIDETSTLN